MGRTSHDPARLWQSRRETRGLQGSTHTPWDGVSGVFLGILCPVPPSRPPNPEPTSQLHSANLCCLSHLVCWYTEIHTIPFYFCAVGRNVPSFFFKQEPLPSKLFIYLLLALLGSRCRRRSLSSWGGREHALGVCRLLLPCGP